MKEYFVVIPCLNEVLYIENLITPLLLKDVDVVVVDGGSDDGTLDVLSRLISDYSNLTLLHNPKKIQSAAVNMAAIKFQNDYKYMIRIDAHADYPEDYCDVLIDEIKRTNASSVVVSMINVSKSFKQSIIAASQSSILGNGGSKHRFKNNDGFFTEHGHHAAFELSSFLSIGGYDESFVANEDAEFDFRLIKNNSLIWHTSKTVVSYYPRDSFKRLVKQYFRYGYGRCSNFIKHKTKPKLRQLLPIVLTFLFVLAFLYPVSNVLAFPFLFLATLIFFASFVEAVFRFNIVYSLTFYPILLMNISWGLGFLYRIIRR